VYSVTYFHSSETAKLKVDNLARTTFGFSPVSFRAPLQFFCYRYWTAAPVGDSSAERVCVCVCVRVRVSVLEGEREMGGN